MLFKILQGNEINLPEKRIAGYCYFLKDTHYFYVDYPDPNSQNADINGIVRAKLSSEYADKLRYYENNTIVELDPKDIPLRSELIKKVFLTQAEYDALSTKDPNTLYIITDAPEEDEGTVIRTEVTISTNNTSTITMPSTLSEFENLMVYHNGILLIEGVNYSRNGSVISLIDYTAEIGDIFTFINKEISAEAQYAKSWAVGDTGVREDEATNNSKYWAEFAQSVSSVADTVKYHAQDYFTPSERLIARNNIHIQLATMPTASADYIDHIIQYVGITGTYKNGYFYKCVNNSDTYSWVLFDWPTRSEMDAAVTNVNNKFEDYPTKVEMNTAILQAVDTYILEVLEGSY